MEKFIAVCVIVVLILVGAPSSNSNCIIKDVHILENFLTKENYEKAPLIKVSNEPFAKRIKKFEIKTYAVIGIENIGETGYYKAKLFRKSDQYLVNKSKQKYIKKGEMKFTSLSFPKTDEYIIKIYSLQKGKWVLTNEKTMVLEKKENQK
ncbi:MAG: hypothetical protein KAX49_01520 [Halanaerobiales bacterium]|nr:hypothetical protein [Halanaerobiales bacterium]